MTAHVTLIFQPQDNRSTLSSKGFTLLEILVVIVIIGMTLGFALLAFGDFGEKRRVMVAADHFANYIKLVQQQAVLEANTFGIRIEPQSYQALRFSPQKGWHVVSNNALFQPQHLAKGILIESSSAPKNKKATPQILIHASEDMTPFTLYFGSNTNTKIAIVQGLPDGSVSIQSQNAP